MSTERYERKRSSVDDSFEDGMPDPGSSTGQKVKIPRSRMACLQCRSRRSKCGSQPPHPCAKCVEAGMQCTWPAVDGRSVRAKMANQGKKTTQETSQAQLPLPQSNGDGTAPGWLDMLSTFGGGSVPNGGINFGQPSDLQGGSEFQSSINDLQDVPSDTDWTQIPSSSTQPFFSSQDSNIDLAQLQQSFFGNSISPSSFPSLDPQQFVWAFSSRLPFVEESSPPEQNKSAVFGISPKGSVTSLSDRHEGKGKDVEGKIMKITWWRPHGQTAIAPGLKRITLKVRVDQQRTPFQTPSPSGNLSGTMDPSDWFLPDGMPVQPIMRHLLDIFTVHFTCQFPYLSKPLLERQLEKGTGSVFLFNCICSVAARFSTHPAIARAGLEPHAYGNIFNARAKTLLGNMMGVPSRDTVAGFLLLALSGAGNDSESEVWMMIGIAVRMSIDLGLHINPARTRGGIASEDMRLNRLLFWSVLMFDHALSFGVGRTTSFPTKGINQVFPTEEDVRGETRDDGLPRSPFPFAARMTTLYAPLINMLNEDSDDLEATTAAIQSARTAIINEYNQLPDDMHWNIRNLQLHNRVNQAPIFLWLHLWAHTILASECLTDSDRPRKSEPTTRSSIPNSAGGAATPNSATASALWRNSARTIGDILVLSDIVNPFAYLPLELVNQCFYVAASCYVKEIEGSEGGYITQIGNGHETPPSRDEDDSSHRKRAKQRDLSRALLTSVAKENILTLQQGLDKQTKYWSSIAWIAGSLAQRIEGIGRHDLDLADITEKMNTFVSLPDAGLADQEVTRSEKEKVEEMK